MTERHLAGDVDIVSTTEGVKELSEPRENVADLVAGQGFHRKHGTHLRLKKTNLESVR